MSSQRTFCLTVSLCFLLAIPTACSDDDSGDSGKTGGAAGSGGGSGGGAGDAGDAGISPDSGNGGSSGSAASGGSGGSGGGGGDCSDYGQGTDCALCLDQSCCAQAGACESDTDCAAIVECARQCPDPADGSSQCVQDCFADHGPGGQLYNALLLCMGQQCGEVCPFL